MNTTTPSEAPLAIVEDARVNRLSAPRVNQSQALFAAFEKIVSAGNLQQVEAIERLAKLARETAADEAKRDFAADFHALQQEMKGVVAKRIVPNDDGTQRFAFASYEDLRRQVDPLLKKYGFSVDFEHHIIEDGRFLEVVCIVTHVNGHERRRGFPVPAEGRGPPKTSEAQAMGSNASYAMRRALCGALGIVVEHIRDARDEGEFVTTQLAADLRDRLAKSRPADRNPAEDEAAFLTFAAAPSFDKITTGRLPELSYFLRRREMQQKPPAPTTPATDPAQAPAKKGGRGKPSKAGDASAPQSSPAHVPGANAGDPEWHKMTDAEIVEMRQTCDEATWQDYWTHANVESQERIMRALNPKPAPDEPTDEQLLEEFVAQDRPVLLKWARSLSPRMIEEAKGVANIPPSVSFEKTPPEVFHKFVRHLRATEMKAGQGK